MISADRYVALVDLIYASAVDPAAWKGAIEAIQGAVSGCGALLGLDIAGKPSLFEFTGYDSAAMESFASTYATRSYVWGLLRQTPEGVPIHDRRVLTPELRQRDTFANEWAVRYDTTDCVVLPLIKRERATAFAVFARAPCCGEFDPQTQALIERLRPHLQRAARIRVQLEDAEFSTNLGFEAIEKIHHSVVLVAGDGAVLFANAAARRLFETRGSGLTLRNSRLTARQGDQNGLLQRLIGQSAGLVDGTRTGGALAVQQEDGFRPLTICSVPLPNEHRWSAEFRNVTLLLIADTAQQYRPAEATLRALFQLTRAEARLALRLIDGATLAQAAADLAVARTTVASQLRSIFCKTRTNRQADLIRLLQAIPKLSTGNDLDAEES